MQGALRVGVRTIGMSEDYTMSLFDAAALGVAYFNRHKRLEETCAWRIAISPAIRACNIVAFSSAGSRGLNFIFLKVADFKGIRHR